MRRLRYTVMAAMAMMRPQRGVVWRLEFHEKRARDRLMPTGAFDPAYELMMGIKTRLIL